MLPHDARKDWGVPPPSLTYPRSAVSPLRYNTMKPQPKPRRTPPKPRRRRVLRIRFSDPEWTRINATFPVRGVSTSIRALALGQPVPRRSPALEIRRGLLLAVARIGNNLNQLARAVNTANLTGSKVDALRLLAKLVEIQEQVENL